MKTGPIDEYWFFIGTVYQNCETQNSERLPPGCSVESMNTSIESTIYYGFHQYSQGPLSVYMKGKLDEFRLSLYLLVKRELLMMVGWMGEGYLFCDKKTFFFIFTNTLMYC